MNAPVDAVVVAVGTDDHDAALAFAATEARRSGRPLHLIHVLQLPAGEDYMGVYGGLLDSAEATLEVAMTEAEALAGDTVAVTDELVDSGWVVEELVRRTKGAGLLVLQHRDLSRVRRLFGGSVAQSVAGRAFVPVVSVPEGWRLELDPSPVVTACVQDPVEAHGLLRVAFEAARASHAEVVVLHSWWLSSGGDIVVVDAALRDDWSARHRQEIAPVLEPLEREFPHVEVSIEVQHAPPVEAVLDAARRSDLLVLGRRHHLLPLGSHLGPVARAALEHAACPVLITPEDATQDARSASELAASRR